MLKMCRSKLLVAIKQFDGEMADIITAIHSGANILDVIVRIRKQLSLLNSKLNLIEWEYEKHQEVLKAK